MDDISLEVLLYFTSVSEEKIRPVPDWNYVYREMKRKGVTLHGDFGAVLRVLMPMVLTRSVKKLETMVCNRILMIQNMEKGKL